MLQTEHDALGYLNDPAALAAFVHLGIAQQRMGNAHRIPGPTWLACEWRPLPDAERLHEHVRIVSEGV